MPDDPGRISGFTLLGRLGAGGMGQVYLGRTPAGDRVAVKVVHRHLADRPDFRERFRREVAAAARVSGAFTAEVVAADPDADPPWMATAYVDGVSLAAVVTRDGPRPVAEVWEIGAGTAQALVAIHEAGLVHRDLKPANVMMAADGPRVIDFGIARALDATGLTGTGAVVGTPGFIAPERLRSGEVDGRGDVFSLGAMLCWTATGRMPFGTGSPGALMYRIVHTEPDLSGVAPPQLRRLVGACLAKDPAERPTPADVASTCRRAAAALTDAPTRIAGSPAPHSPPPPRRNPDDARRASPPMRRRVLLAGAVAALAGGGGLALRWAAVGTGASGSQARTTPRAVGIRRLTTLTGHGGAISCLAWSRDGRSLASGSEDRTVRLWDVGTDVPTARGVTIRHASTIRSVAFGPGTALAVLDTSGDLRVWDAATGSLSRQLARGGSAGLGDVPLGMDGRLVYSASGRYLAQGTDVWDLQSTSTISQQTVDVRTLAASGRAAVRSGGLASYDLDTGRSGRALPLAGDVLALDASADGSVAVRIGGDSSLWFDDLRSTTSRQVRATKDVALAAAFAAGDRALAVVRTDGRDTLQLWDVAAGAVTAEFGTGSSGGRVEAVAVAPSGSALALGMLDDAVEIWATG